MLLGMNRTVNVELLKAAFDERGNLGKEKLALETGVVTVNALDKMISTRKAPRPISRERLSRALRVSQDVLFPEVNTSQKKRA